MTQAGPVDAESIERHVRINARLETVFEHFTDPAKLVRWMGKDATLDAVPGGVFRVDYGKGDIASGSYREVDRPKRIVFTWGWEAAGDEVPPGASTVEVALEPDGEATVLTLRHTGLPAASRDGHAEGWDLFLPRLVLAAEG